MSSQDDIARSTSISLSRQSILDATDHCLAEVGYDGATIRKIASKLGCAVGSIYRYFKDKRELLSAVCQQRFEQSAATIESGASVEQSAREYIQAALSSPETYRLMFWLASVGRKEAVVGPALLPPIVSRIIEGWAKRLSHPPIAQQAWAALHGSIMLGLGADELTQQLRRAIDGLPQTADELVGARTPTRRPRLVTDSPEEQPAETPARPTSPLRLVAAQAKVINESDDDITML